MKRLALLLAIGLVLTGCSTNRRRVPATPVAGASTTIITAAT